MNNTLEIATISGGCFWCIAAFFQCSMLVNNLGAIPRGIKISIIE